ncbi:hypothetical protein NP493_115g15003 [Ridgeia piscesae]|uniref:LIM zinc-binding domain-containing protein n=1 Tax=Ridgeia piscesae TaxID=27915 RepID=A0AAD9P6L4_RIDPI|nr:hypothetical protein NP493_115g15003 [Ridgeia piscesae]
MVEKTMLGLIRDQETPSEQLDLEYATLQHTTFPLLKSDPEPCRCAACGDQILERYYLLAVDKQWHVSCLKCSQCHLSLDSQLTCFEKDGHIYCKEDYYRRFAVKQCSRCHEGITANELVMKARHLVFHLGCFTCASCNKVLTTGDHFGISGDTVFCRQHYQLALRTDLRVADMSPTDMSPVSNMSSGADLSLGYGPGSQPNAAPLPFYNGTGAVQKGRPRKRSHQSTELDRCDQLVGKCTAIWETVAFWEHCNSILGKPLCLLYVGL